MKARKEDHVHSAVSGHAIFGPEEPAAAVVEVATLQAYWRMGHESPSRVGRNGREGLKMSSSLWHQAWGIYVTSV